MRYHAVERTSPTGPGQKFVGRCTLCGVEGLDIYGALLSCPNPRGSTREDVLCEAILGPEEITVSKKDLR